MSVKRVTFSITLFLILLPIMYMLTLLPYPSHLLFFITFMIVLPHCSSFKLCRAILCPTFIVSSRSFNWSSVNHKSMTINNENSNFLANGFSILCDFNANW